MHEWLSLQHTPEPARSNAIEASPFEFRHNDPHHTEVDAARVRHIGRIHMADARRSQRLEEHSAVLIDVVMEPRRQRCEGHFAPARGESSALIVRVATFDVPSRLARRWCSPAAAPCTSGSRLAPKSAARSSDRLHPRDRRCDVTSASPPHVNSPTGDGTATPWQWPTRVRQWRRRCRAPWRSPQLSDLRNISTRRPRADAHQAMPAR